MTQQATFSAGKAVIVTGCSSGIGRATAVVLAEQGFTVFATVRKDKDADSLRSLHLPGLIPVCPLDLTNSSDMTRAIATIERELDARHLALYAIVHNAGGGGIAPIELMDIERYRTEVEVRLVAPVRLLQAFLPRIRKAHGRIVWIATPSLMPIPYVSAIHAPDFAVNCLARTLQLELKPWAIPNILIRCGTIATAAPARSAHELEEDFKQWPPERFALYEAALRKEVEEFGAFDAKRTDPREVGMLVYKALTAARPKARYQIGYLSKLAAAVEYLPQSWVDRIMAGRA